MFGSVKVSQLRVGFVSGLFLLALFLTASGSLLSQGQRSQQTFPGTFSGSSSAPPFTIIDAPGAGGSVLTGTAAFVLDAAGDVAGVYLDATGNEHAYIRRATGAYTTIDPKAATSGPNKGAAPLAFDSAGDLLGVYLDANKVAHGFLVAASNGTITILDAPGAGTGSQYASTPQGTFPLCINPRGDIVGIYSDTNNEIHGFVRTAATGTIVPFVVQQGQLEGTALSINATGTVAGTYEDAGKLIHGFVRNATTGAITVIDAPSAGNNVGQGTAVYGIDTAGDIAGMYADGNSLIHGFVRSATSGNFTTIDAPGAGTGLYQGTYPMIFDAAGDIAGTYTDANNLLHGFMRTAGGTISTFDAPGAGATANARSRRGNLLSRLGRKSSSDASVSVSHSKRANPFLNKIANVLSQVGGIRNQVSPAVSMTGGIFNTPSGMVAGTLSLGIDTAGDLTGIYSGGDDVAHGFMRAANGSITTFDAPSAGSGSMEGTGSFSINAAGMIVGTYADENSVIHGYLLQLGQVATQTTLTGTPASTLFGEPVTFTAKVTSSGSTVPDGETVWFMDGSTTLGTETLTGGRATFTTTDLPGGTDSITAVYGGDTKFAGSKSTAVSETVGKASSSTKLTTSLNVAVFSQFVTLTGTVSGQFGGTATGTMIFKNGGTILGTESLVGGSAAITTAALPFGTDTVTAVYNGDPDFAASTSGAVSVTVSKATPTVSWTTPSAIPYGTQLSATQLDAIASVPGKFVYSPPAGTILSAGSTTLSVTFTPTDAIDYTGAQAQVRLVVTAAGSITPVVTVTPESTAITSAQPLIANVSVKGGNGNPTPTGMVILSSGSFVSDATALNGGAAIIDIPAGWLAQGNDTLTATYVPDSAGSSIYSGATGTSVPVAVSSGTAPGGLAVALTVTSAGSPVTTVHAGSVVTLTATVKNGSTALTTGQVNFCDASGASCTDIHLLGTAQLTSTGIVSIKFRPGIGDQSYRAVFAATKTYQSGGASSVSKLTVTPAGAGYPVSTAITQSGDVGNYTLTATVGGFGTAAPTGTLSFLDSTYGNAVLGTASLTPGAGGLNWLSSETPVGPWPESVAVGDLNGDGIPDLAVANGDDGTVTILLGNGNGSFATAPNSPIAVDSPNSMTVGDFNGDGIPDLAVVNVNDSTVTILLGSGNGSFTQAPNSPVAVGQSPGSMAVGDFNGDGVLDLAVTNFNGSSSGTITFLFGSGSGTFTQAANRSLTVANGASSIVVGDFNGDGFSDVAVANQNTNTVTIFLGGKTGTFAQAPGSPVTVGGSWQSLAVGDFNQDGKLDLAVSNSGNGSVTILLGSGNGAFTQAAKSPVSAGNSPGSMAVGDFNGDGIPDLAVVNPYGSSSGGGLVTILLGNGDGTFAPAANSPVPVGYSPESIAVGDFNGDGASDLVLPDMEAGAATILLTGTQSASASVSGISVTGLGPHQAVASYPGDSDYNASTSAATALYAPSPAPVFSPASGLYTSAQTVTISDSIPGATIYYSTDGYAPGTWSTKYLGPITVSQSESIQAIAVGPGYAPGAISTATYSISLPVVATPVISPGSKVFTNSQAVTITDATPGAAIYFTTDGSMPTTWSTKYTGGITVSSTETLEAIAVASGYSNSAVSTATYSNTAQAATPTFSPAAGSYTSVQSVAISDATAGATIYYTADGSMPTTSSTVYSSRITVGSTMTIQAIAKSPGLASSAVATANYGMNVVGASLALITNNPNPVLGESVTLDAILSLPPSSNESLGAYWIYDGSTVLVPGAMPNTTSGYVDVTSALTVGLHTVTAKYVGFFNGVTVSSSPITLLVVAPTTATPTFSVVAGPYSSVQTVAISDATNSAIIYYTANGTTPTTSSAKYTGAITVAATETLEAMAVAPGNTQSAVAVASYTINLPKTMPTLTWPAPSAITYGTPLGATQLDATSSVSGTFVYSPPAGTVLNAGAQTLSVAFTPADPTKYTTAHATASLTVNKASPSAILTASSSSITVGASDTLTATVSGVSGGTIPTGRVTFFSGSTSLGTGTLNSSGVATLATSALATGTDSITFTYPGDANYAPATSAAISIKVNSPVAPTITLSSSPASPVYGASVTLTATLTGSGSSKPTGAVTFLMGATSLGSGTVNASGVATLATTTLPVGTDSITASYAGDPNYAAATSAAISVTVSKASQTVTFTAPTTPVTYGVTPIALTASASSGLTVTFTVTGPATVNNNSLTITGAGSAVVTANQAGNSNYAAATAVQHTITVNKATSTASLTSSESSGTYGTSVTLTAKLTNAGAGSLAASGTVTFLNGTTTLGTGSLNSAGVATLTLTTLPVGTNSITASYGGDSNYAAATSSATSTTVSKAAQTINFTPPVSPVFYGAAPIALTATATSGLPVTFTVASGSPATVNGSTLTITGVGSVVVAANQAGNTNYAAAPTVSKTITVAPAAPSAVLTSSAASATFGTSITFTATVTGSGSTKPSGTVTFLNGSASLGTGTLNSSGVATFATTALPVGTDSITARYQGDSHYSPVTSAILTETIKKIAPAAKVSSSASTAAYGTSITLTATLSGSGGSPTGTVTFLNGAASLGTGTLNSSGIGTLATTTLPVGSNSITVSYAGDANYSPANSTATTVTVTKATQAINFTAPTTPVTYGVAAIALKASGGASGLPVTFSSTGPATVNNSNSTLTITGAGSVVVTANQAGNGNYSAAPAVSKTITVNKVTPKASLISSESSGAYGAPVTLTATLTNAGTGSVEPTGTVSFLSGTTTLGTGSLNSSGVATLKLTTLPVGNDSITASYGGDSNYASVKSSATSITVGKAAQTINFTAPASPVFYGAAPIALAATATSGLPITFTVASGSPATVSGSTLTITGVGTVTIAANQAGNGNYAAATAVQQKITVQPGTATIKLTSSAASVTYGTSITLTATLSGSGSAKPSGTVTFYNGAASAGTGVLNTSGVATLTLATLPAGNASFTARFPGDTRYGAATSATALAETVKQATPTVKLTATPSTAAFGASVTLTATLTGPGAKASGTVTFFNGTTSIGTGTLNSGGVATLALTTLPVGTDSIKVSYAGDSNYLAATSSASTVTIGKAAQTISFTAPPATVAYGVTPITLTATATSGLPVTFKASGPATVNGSTLTITGAGTVTITANQPGNGHYNAATAVSKTITVNKATATASLQASVPTVTSGAQVAFTAAVAGPGSTVPSSVTFLDGTATLGTGTLASGAATYSTTKLTTGKHTITAKYAGDSNYLAATSAAVNVTVNAK